MDIHKYRLAVIVTAIIFVIGFSSMKGLAIDVGQNQFDTTSTPAIRNQGFESWSSYYDASYWTQVGTQNSQKTTYERSGSYAMRLIGSSSVTIEQTLTTSVKNFLKGKTVSFGVWAQAYDGSTNGDDDKIRVNLRYQYETYFYVPNEGPIFYKTWRTITGSTFPVSTNHNKWTYASVEASIPSSATALKVQIVALDSDSSPSVYTKVDDAGISVSQTTTSSKTHGVASMNTQLFNIREKSNNANYYDSELSTTIAIDTTKQLSTTVLKVQLQIYMYPNEERCKTKIWFVCTKKAQYTTQDGDVNIFNIGYGNGVNTKDFSKEADRIQDSTAKTASWAVGKAAGTVGGALGGPVVGMIAGSGASFLTHTALASTNSWDTDANGGWDYTTNVKHDYSVSNPSSYPSRISRAFLTNDFDWIYAKGHTDYYIKIVARVDVGHYNYNPSTLTTPGYYYKVVDDSWTLTQYIYV